MKNRKYFLTSGEFAKMNGINKRTLHYYNDIGLFRPEMIDENGYHYYSRFQAVQLEMILIFRRLGLSIEEIRTYTDHPSDASFSPDHQGKAGAHRPVRLPASGGKGLFTAEAGKAGAGAFGQPWKDRTDPSA